MMSLSVSRRSLTLSIAIGALLLGIVATSLSADVIIMQNGQRREGVVEDNPNDKSSIIFTTVTGPVTIPRAGITEIQKSTPAESWRSLGDQLMQRKQYPEALTAFERGLASEPTNAELRQRVESAKAGMNTVAQTAQDDNRDAALKLIAEAAQLADEKKFDDASAKLQAAEKRAGDILAPELTKAYGDLNFRWGISLVDRLNNPGAAEKIELALQRDPTNPAYQDKLIEIYERMPDRKAQVLGAYQTKLERDPGNSAIRRKVAKLLYEAEDYQGASRMMLQLAQDKALDGPADMLLLKNSLSQVVDRATNARDYTGARENYQHLMTFFPEDPSYDRSFLDYMDYYIMANGIDQNNAYDHAELGTFALDRSLTTLAKQSYKRSLELKSDLADASNGMMKIAALDLGEARRLYSAGDFDNAKATADLLQVEFAMLPQIAEQAKEISDRSSNAILEKQRNNTRNAMRVAQTGDEYYARAQGYMAQLQSSEFNFNVRSVSPKNEAIRYLQRALEAWRAALSLDRALGPIDGMDLNNKIADAERQLRVLTSAGPGLPSGLRETRRIREQNSRNSSNNGTPSNVTVDNNNTNTGNQTPIPSTPRNNTPN